MAWSIVILDKEADEYTRLLCFFFYFTVLHSCGRPELHQSSDRALQHGTEVGSGNTISPLIVVSISHFTVEPDGDSRGPIWSRKGGDASDLLSYAPALSLSSSDVHVLYRRVKAGAN